MQLGLHRGLSQAEYFAIEAVNASTLREFSRSAAHAHYAMTHPEDTAELRLGSAVHCAVLEPPRFLVEYVKAPKVDKRTTVGKAAWARFLSENEGKAILTADEWATCIGMRDAVWAHPIAKQILSAPGPCEVSALGSIDGEPAKARIDKLARWNDATWVVDLKTCRDARPFAWERDIAKYSYHVQAAWYLDVLDSLAPAERRFLWLCVEKDPPHCVALYEPAAGVLEQGRHEAEKYLKLYSECRETGVYPGYEVGIQPISLPRYAMTVEEWEVGT